MALAVAAQQADLLLYHGKIVTVDPQFHIAGSLAVRGDRIVAVGAREEVARYAGPHTRRVDLQGKNGLAWTH